MTGFNFYRFMNIYKLTQHDNRGCDTYDSMIVCAISEAEARLISPKRQWELESSPVWANSPESVKVELIGVAVPSLAKGIILASFNAR